MKMGHSSSSGSAELWAMCDSEEVAGDVHSKLNKIIERESEKKKQMPNGLVPALSPFLHVFACMWMESAFRQSCPSIRIHILFIQGTDLYQAWGMVA